MKKLRRIISLGWLGLFVGLGLQTAELRAAGPPALEVRELRLESAAGHKRLNWRFSTAPAEVKSLWPVRPAAAGHRCQRSGSGDALGQLYDPRRDGVAYPPGRASPAPALCARLQDRQRCQAYTIAHDGTRLSALVQTPGDNRQASRQLFPPIQTAAGQAAPATHTPPRLLSRRHPPLPRPGKRRLLRPGCTCTNSSSGLRTTARRSASCFLSRPHSVRSFALSDPPRLVLDVTGPVAPGPSARYTARDALVSAVRIGSHPDRLRFVVDLSGTRIPPFEVRQQENRLRPGLYPAAARGSASPGAVSSAGYDRPGCPDADRAESGAGCGRSSRTDPGRTASGNATRPPGVRARAAA